MNAFFEDPLSARSAWLAGLGLVLGGGVYCFAYNGLAGTPEPLSIGLAWSLVNLAPWLAAFELCKRLNHDPAGPWVLNWGGIAAILMATAIASVAMERLITSGGDAAPLLFAFVRRLPSAALVAALLLVAPMLRRQAGRRERTPAKAEADPPLPLLPSQIDWIKAAGNYLEIRAGGRLVLERMTMATAEAMLEAHGFVRIHRSALVNRDRIVRHAKGKMVDEVLLADGTWLRVGGAYRARVDGRAASQPA